MKETVEVTTSHCTLCKWIKHPKPEAHSTLGQTTSQEKPQLHHWSMDFVHFPTSRQGQYNYLLTIMDYTTRWFKAYPVWRATTATVKQILLTDFIPSMAQVAPSLLIKIERSYRMLSNNSSKTMI
jgi:hypothetical protein